LIVTFPSIDDLFVGDVFRKLFYSAPKKRAQPIEMISERAIAPLIDHFRKGHAANTSCFREFNEGDTSSLFKLFVSKQFLYAIANHCSSSLTEVRKDLRLCFYVLN